MRTLGIDQSYTSTGWVVLNDGVVEQFGVIKTSVGSAWERARCIADGIIQLIYVHFPDQVRLEGLAFGIRGDATRDLAGLQFLIVDRLMRLGTIFAVVPPTSLKKFATGSGKATKKDVIASLPVEVNALFSDAGYKLTTGKADLADAYFLAKWTK